MTFSLLIAPHILARWLGLLRLDLNTPVGAVPRSQCARWIYLRDREDAPVSSAQKATIVWRRGVDRHSTVWTFIWPLRCQLRRILRSQLREKVTLVMQVASGAVGVTGSCCEMGK